ncbi:MAG: acetyl-CoA carboxylase biotin carboxyl carrier protein [Calothrix sp. SM1_7_51]|nr:acetyl-CoA carboxylase biotin carboxyl carrier protein [Calothrix sp. SM1_7_51]
MPLDFNEIRQLLATIAQTDIAEVTLKSDDFEITVRKAVSFSNQMLPVGQTVSGGVGAYVVPSAAVPNAIPSANVADGATNRISDTNVAGATQSSPAHNAIDQRLVEVPSPMVGTFYRAPAPGEAPFVEVGDRIRSGQTVCIIEAMKLMNEIEAEVSGQVMEILVQNGEPVEYGQPLMRINPD